SLKLAFPAERAGHTPFCEIAVPQSGFACDRVPDRSWGYHESGFSFPPYEFPNPGLDFWTVSLSLLDSLNTYEFGNALPSPTIPAEDGSQFMSMSFPRRISRLPFAISLFLVLAGSVATSASTSGKRLRANPLQL